MPRRRKTAIDSFQEYYAASSSFSNSDSGPHSDGPEPARVVRDEINEYKEIGILHRIQMII